MALGRKREMLTGPGTAGRRAGRTAGRTTGRQAGKAEASCLLARGHNSDARCERRNSSPLFLLYHSYRRGVGGGNGEGWRCRGWRKGGGGEVGWGRGGGG